MLEWNTTDGWTDEYRSTTEGYLDFWSPTTENSSTFLVDHSTNLTGVKGAQTQLLLYDLLIPGIGALIIVLNLAVVVSSGLIIKGGAQPKTTYLFLGNVAMADLVTGVAVIFGQLYPKHKRDQITCAIQIGMIVSSTVVSIWSVVLIAVDRFLFILHGLKYQRWLFPCRARWLIFGTWLIGLVGYLPAMGWSGKTDGGRICWFIRLAPPKLIILTTVIGVTPIGIVCVLYSIILYHAMRKVMQLRKADKDADGKKVMDGEDKPHNMRVFRGGKGGKENTENDQKRSSPTKWKAIKVVLFTTGSFVLTWVPYFIACCLFVFCDQGPDGKGCKTLRVAIASPLAILGFLNSLINPVIYAWWHNGFRTSMRKFLCPGREKKKQKAQALAKMKAARKQNTKSSEKSSSAFNTSTKASNSSQKSTSSSLPISPGPYIEDQEMTHF